jgi:cytidylate kinase
MPRTTVSPARRRPAVEIARTVTISATYGAAGSVIAPALADRLGLPFFDRLLRDPATTAERLIERLSEEEGDDAPPGAVATLAHVTAGLGFPIPDTDDLNPREAMRARIEASVTRIAQSGGVILGRGAVVVLAGAPFAFHVRLDGPVERRIRHGMRIEAISEAEARQHQTVADREWSRFGQRVFKRDFSDPRLYHLVLDTTAFDVASAVEVLAVAAAAYWERAPAST